MSTLIGRRERVAFEFELEETSEEHRSWIFGRMCLWVDGKRIGRHHEVCAMTVVMTTIAMHLQCAGDRTDTFLMAKPAAEAFATIHEAFYGHEELSYHELRKIAEWHERFKVSSQGFDYFDGWYAYLVEEQLAGRVLWRTPDDVIHEARIGAGEFDRVLEDFVSTLERISGQTRAEPWR